MTGERLLALATGCGAIVSFTQCVRDRSLAPATEADPFSAQCAAVLREYVPSKERPPGTLAFDYTYEDTCPPCASNPSHLADSLNRLRTPLSSKLSGSRVRPPSTPPPVPEQVALALAQAARRAALALQHDEMAILVVAWLAGQAPL